MKAVNIDKRKVVIVPDKFRARIYLVMHIGGCSIGWRDKFADLYPDTEWVLIFETNSGKIAVPMPKVFDYEYDFSLLAKPGKEKK